MTVTVFTPVGKSLTSVVGGVIPEPLVISCIWDKDFLAEVRLVPQIFFQCQQLLGNIMDTADLGAAKT